MYKEIIKSREENFEKVLEHFRQELGQLRTGRASTALVENLLVDYYGSKSPMKQVASITIPEPRTIMISPWDKGSLVGIESAIRESQLNLNPVNDGQVVRINILALTEERRKELVKVLNQNGSGWSSVVARGIVYVADLKAGPLKDYPVVINMSLGGPVLDAMEQAAIDYAIEQGVIIVASAGNSGLAGMGYPGAYEPVISVAAAGWIGEWYQGSRTSWYALNVADPTNPNHIYITDFSSRELTGQDLDVAAPGSWVVGPYQVNRGQTSYYFLGGTSMASPHVAGIVALMAQKDPGLIASQAEAILEDTALVLGPGCRTVYTPYGTTQTICWDTDATGWGLVDAQAALDEIP